jgi:Immunity protein Imm1
MPKAQAISVSIPGHEPGRSAALDELSQQLAELSDNSYAEVWVDHEPFPSLCVLVNGQSAWLMCMRHDGDAGFSSRNPAYVGDREATLEFYLSNGQRDEYPAAWTYPTRQVVEAVQLFAAERRLPAWIAWFNDSGDGTRSPSDPWPESE